jgi:hypothetical protein
MLSQGICSAAHGNNLQPNAAQSTSIPGAAAFPQQPLSRTAPASTPILAYGSVLPFASGAGLSLYQGYHAHRNYFGGGYGRGYHGYGYRNSSLVNARMRRLAKLVRDLNALTVGHASNPNEQNILRNDLMGVTQGGSRPPTQAVRQLSGSLVNHLPTRKTYFLNTEQLALDLEVVMNGGRVTPTRVSHAISSAGSLMRSSGVPQAGVEAVIADLKSIGFPRVAGNAGGVVR